MILSGKKPCPVCHSPVEKGAERCPHCNTDLKGGASAAQDNTLDDILAGIMDDRSKATMVRGTGEEIDLDLQGEPPPEAAPPPPTPPTVGKAEALEFECPSCGSSVPESTTRCPHCGAAFSDSEQFDCPVCGSAVPFEAVQCPKCGVRFVEDSSLSAGSGLDLSFGLGLGTSNEPQGKGPPGTTTSQPAQPTGPRPTEVESLPALRPRADTPLFTPTAQAPADWAQAAPAGPLPNSDLVASQARMSELVAEVKRLIVLGKRAGLSLGNMSGAITQAVELSRRREFTEAVALMEDARSALRRSFVEQLSGRLGSLAVSLGRPGGREGPAAAAVGDGQVRIQAQDLEGAVAALERAQGLMASGDPRAIQARNSLERAKGAVQEAAAMGIPVPGANDMVNQASRALAKGEWDTAAGGAGQAWDLATSTIRNVLGEEMKRSRNLVFDLKMKGEGVDRAIEILKQASARLKEGDLKGAHQLLQVFRSEMPRSR